MPQRSQEMDVAVVGAGPAGILAALFAAKNGARVCLLDKNPGIGRKLLVTGNGRCNLTNRSVTPARYHGADPAFVAAVLKGFDPARTESWFGSIGVALKVEDQGRVFPRSDKSSQVVEALRRELERTGILIQTGQTVTGIRREGSGFFLSRTNDPALSVPRLILACGGIAGPQFGSTGDGLAWVRELGHRVTPLFPALTPVETEEPWVKDLMGSALPARITVQLDGLPKAEAQGDLLFTHYGLSGPVILGLARSIAPLLDQGRVTLLVNLAPDRSPQELNRTINDRLTAGGKHSVKNSLAGLLSRKVLSTLCDLSRVTPGIPATKTTPAARQRLCDTIQRLVLTVKKLRPMTDAQVTAGGVDTRELTEGMASRLVPGLFMAGEIVDVDGDTGGFSLQWAWSSGAVAGLSASR